MPRVKKICNSCKKEIERAEKPKPKNTREAKQVDFICPGCGSANLRDGTARYLKKKSAPVVSKIAEPNKHAEKLGEDNPGADLKIEPEKKEITHDEIKERDDSWLII